MTKLASMVVAALLIALTSVNAMGGECVSMLVDFSGSISFAKSPSAKSQDRWPANLLQCFFRDTVLSLAEADKATLYFPLTGIAVGLRGKGQYVVEPNAVRPLGSAPPPSSTVLDAVFKGIKLTRTGLTPAGFRMREAPSSAGIVPIAPKGIVTDVDSPVFRWEQGDTKPPYRIRIVTSSKSTVYESSVTDGEFTLPREIALKAGEELLWRVEPVASSAGAGRWQDFVIATREARELAAQIDQAVPSPTDAERNLRALLLLQRMSSQP